MIRPDITALLTGRKTPIYLLTFIPPPPPPFLSASVVLFSHIAIVFETPPHPHPRRSLFFLPTSLSLSVRSDQSTRTSYSLSPVERRVHRATDASTSLNPRRSQSNICAEFREEEFAQSSQRNEGSSSSLRANRLLSVRRHACRQAALRVGQQITDSTARDTHLQTLTYSVNVSRAFFFFFSFFSSFFPFCI